MEKSIDNKPEPTIWTAVWRGTNIVMSIFFLCAAYVQLNDPDAVIWVVAYMVPAFLSLAIGIKPSITDSTIWKMTSLVHIALCVVGSLYVMTMVFQIEELMKNMTNPFEHEEGRELGGLTIIIAWLCVCRFTSFGSSEPGKGIGNGLLLMTAIFGLFPLVFWALCFFDSIGPYLGHCKDMFPGMLGTAYK